MILRSLLPVTALLTCIAAASGCACGSNDTTPRAPHQSAPAAGVGRPAAAPPTVLFIGTSLTAGLGLDPSQAYPALVERLADSAGTPLVAENAGVSGETSAGALQRIGWVLRRPADVVVLETGANDGLRGVPVATVRANLLALIDSVRRLAPGVPVALVQMEAPPNMGNAYATAFHALYGEVARRTGVTLFPFLLDSVAGYPSLNQRDGLHPNAVGARIVARTVWRALRPLVAAATRAPGVPAGASRPAAAR